MYLPDTMHFFAIAPFMVGITLFLLEEQKKDEGGSGLV